jgi:hypothetical protein
MSTSMLRRAAAAVAVMATAIPIATPAVSAAAEDGAGDGATSSTAGASCWGIKQEYPGSADGVYWLNNASLEAPEQYYCDMTTDGGGWVLVGRGRNGWTFQTEMQGSRTAVRDVVDGPAAFTPARLGSAEIDKLLGGQPVDSLADGIRLRRATTNDGSIRQEIRMRVKAGFGRWSWAFDSGILLDDISIDGTSYGTSNTRDTNLSSWAGVGSGLSGSSNNSERRVNTILASNKGWQGGFALGNTYTDTTTRIRGSQSPDDYLWEYTTERYPLGFTQVFIRPRIANAEAGFAALPAQGLPAEAARANLSSRAEVAPWGVVGIDHTNEATTEPWYTNALAIRRLGSTVFVGGRFTGVQNGPNAAQVSQPYLAAFDVTTGEWLSAFRPVLDGRVWAIEVTAQGKLLIGGDFTTVNGDTLRSGLAALDPVTGAVDTSFKADLDRIDTSGQRAIVRDIEVNGNNVYVAGNFNRVTGGTWNQITVTRAVKLSALDGTPQSAWKPQPNGTVISMDTTPAGDRVYMAGYFSSLRGDTTKGYFGAVNGTDGDIVPGLASFQPSVGSSKKYQQATIVDGDHVYVGGSEHNIQKYRLSDGVMVRSHITRQGGDAQAMMRIGDSIYVGCHCGHGLYSDSNVYSPSPAGMSRVDPVNLTAKLSADTFAYDRDFVPAGLKGDRGEGTWAFESTPEGCAYMAGDFQRSGGDGQSVNNWVGGFAKFCPQDAAVPSAPADVAAAPGVDGVRVTFTAGTDGSGSVVNWVYRDDRVVGVTWGNSFTDPAPAGVHRYTVRSVDATGNKSAAPAPLSVTVLPVVVEQPLVTAGSTWQYSDTGAQAPAGWNTLGFSGGWSTGTASFGWNDPVTTTVGASLPVTTYFRKEFPASPDGLASLELRLRRDDGAIAFLNGVEVARSNMPGGPVTASTLATDYAWGAGETDFSSFTLPATLLAEGTNVLAVEVHQASTANADASFDAELVGRGGIGDTDAPAPFTLSGSGQSGTVGLTWDTPADLALGGFTVVRDGMPLAVLQASATSYLDTGLPFGQMPNYQVAAFDTSGNTRWSNSVAVSTGSDPDLMAFGSTWRYSYDGSEPAGGWTGEGYDDSAWAQGAGELGFGDADEDTVLTTAAAPRPLVSYYRATIQLDDPTDFSSVLFDVVRDDGVVVYVNGVEVGRNNMPAGAVTNTTGAVTALTTRAEETTPVTFSVPASAFHGGTNTIAVSVHNTDRWSGDMSFDLRAVGQA